MQCHVFSGILPCGGTFSLSLEGLYRSHLIPNFSISHLQLAKTNKHLWCLFLLDSQHFCHSHYVWGSVSTYSLYCCVFCCSEKQELSDSGGTAFKQGPHSCGYLWICDHLIHLLSIIEKLCLGQDPILQGVTSQLNHGAVPFLTEAFCFVHYSLPNFCKRLAAEALQAVVSSTTQSCHVSCTPSQLCSGLQQVSQPR